MSVPADHSASGKPSQRLLREVAAGLPEPVVDEAAVPSYTHWNPVMRWVMWRRLGLVEDMCRDLPSSVVVDYGTGTGVMLPFLCRIAERVIALDREPLMAERLRSRLGLVNAVVLLVDTAPIPVPNESADLVLCLDILEHVQQLSKVTHELRRVLRPGGHLVVSGPTENAAYRCGRFLAGFAGRAHYHRSNVHDIDRALGQVLTRLSCRHLFRYLRLFELYLYRRD